MPETTDTFNFHPVVKSDQPASFFPTTTSNSGLLTSVLTTAFGNGNVPRDFTFSSSSVQSASTDAAVKPTSRRLVAARAKNGGTRRNAKKSKSKISLIAVNPRPQPALPVELVDKILDYLSKVEQFRVAVALGDISRRDALVPLAFPAGAYPMDAASADGDFDQLDAWRSRASKFDCNSDKSSGVFCMWYSSAAISAALRAKNPRAVLRWWARSKLPLGNCIAAVMATNPSVLQLELLKTCLPTPSEEALRDIMDMPSICGHTGTLNWLLACLRAIQQWPWTQQNARRLNAHEKSGWELRYTEESLDGLSTGGDYVYYGSRDTLDWWAASGLPLKYSAAAIHPGMPESVAHWWKDSRLRPKWKDSTLDFILSHRNGLHPGRDRPVRPVRSCRGLSSRPPATASVTPAPEHRHDDNRADDESELVQPPPMSRIRLE
ncbi:hypothetical protein HDU87_001660 [Geranomyces variabilis]|uniref:Uncharacterized protein n=1 Tax=Geranomyces variabilis TaxID=109894 RepID=A0AAD5XNW6_9FUNG|nr:hypothetical protein HDU87_001660 [Geranomyces variabilis]